MINLHFVFRNLEPSDALKEHVTKKIKKLEKIIPYPLEVHVNLKLEKTFHIVDIDSHAEHREFSSSAKTDDLYESIDMAVAKMETQLRKERDMKKGHKSAKKASRPKSLKEGQDIQAETPHREKKLPISE